MNNLRPIFVFIICIFLLACSSQNSYKKFVEIEINNTSIKDTVDISDKIESLSVTPLIETVNNHFASVYKFFVIKDKLIIYDRLNANKILLFDTAGKFLKTVIKVGDAPDDALNLTDCWLNQNGGLEAYDYGQMKIFQFDTSFLLRKITKSNVLNHFVGLKNVPSTNYYVGYTNFSDFNQPYRNEHYLIGYLDSSLNVINSDKSFDKVFQGITWPIYSRHFYNYKDSLRFVKAYDNFVYDISKSGIAERFKVRYKANSLPDNIMPAVKQHLSIFKNRYLNPNTKANYFKQYFRFTGLWLEGSKYIYLSSRDTQGVLGTSFYSLVDRKTNSELFSFKNLKESSKYKMCLPVFMCYDEINDVFMSVIDGQKLQSLLTEESPLQKDILADPTKFYLIKAKLK